MIKRAVIVVTLLLLAVLPMLAQIPRLVQHRNSSNLRQTGFGGGGPHTFNMWLPDPVISGNTIICGMTFQGTQTPTITDDMKDSFTVEKNFYDKADNVSMLIAALFKPTAGAREVVTTFAENLNGNNGGNFQIQCSALANVTAFDAASPGRVGTGTKIWAGDLTPTAAGDLLYHVAFNLNLSPNTYVQGTGSMPRWTLLSADTMDGLVGQYAVYKSTSTINPAMKMGTSAPWASVAAAFKTGTSGGVPERTHIVRLLSENLPTSTAAGGNGTSFPNPLTIQVPCTSENFVALMAAGGGNGGTDSITSITDNNGGTWVQAGSTIKQGDANAEAWYSSALHCESNLTLTINWGTSGGDQTLKIYTVSGFGSIDTETGCGGGQFFARGMIALSGAECTLSTAVPGELLFLAGAWDNNTGTGVMIPQGGRGDMDTYTDENVNGPQPIDENNPWGHYYSQTTGTVDPWILILQSSTQAVGGWAQVTLAVKPK
jgi:hypothetical protein